MEEPKTLIPDITEESKDWIVRITVTESIPVMTCSNGSKLKRYVLTDKEGNEVIASVYAQDIDILCPMIKLYGVYDISNANVKPVNKPYNILSAAYQWNLQKSTLICEIPQATPNMRFFLDSLTPFSRIADAHKAGYKTTDIMGIIIDADEMRQVNNGCNNVQHFTFINPEKIPISVSVWDEMITSEGQALLQALRNNSVVVAKRLSIKTFDSISLASRNSSSFVINPPVEAAANMKVWFSTLSQSELEQLKSKKTSSFTKELVSRGRMRTYTVFEVQNDAPICDYWVRGSMQFTDETQQLYYVACSNCQTKIKARAGLKYTCFLCKKQVEASLKPIVMMTIVDHTGFVQVVAMESVAEHILHTTSTDMKKLFDMGNTLNLTTVKAELEGKTFLLLLRCTYGRSSEGQRRLLLVSYFQDTTTTTEAMPSNAANSGESSNYENEAELPLSPLKRQLSNFSITKGTPLKKQLTWNDFGKFKNEPKDGNEGSSN